MLRPVPGRLTHRLEKKVIMEEHPNASVVREALTAFNRGDFEQFAAMVADDVNWYEVGASEPLRGKEAVFSSLDRGDKILRFKPRCTTSSPTTFTPSP